MSETPTKIQWAFFVHTDVFCDEICYIVCVKKSGEGDDAVLFLRWEYSPQFHALVEHSSYSIAEIPLFVLAQALRVSVCVNAEPIFRSDKEVIR